MKQTLNEAKHEAKLAEWREVVRECRNSGMKVKHWCKQNGINRKTYYNWQKQVWEAETEKHKNELAKPTEIRFAEVKNIIVEDERKTRSISIEKAGWRVELENDANPAIVSLIIEMVAQYV